MEDTSQVFSIPKMILFVVLFIGLGFVYYKKILDVSDGENKTLKLLKHSFAVLVLLGLLSTFTSVKNKTGRFIIILVILLVINMYNISHSIGKCKYEVEYKINVIGRSTIILLIISLLLYYSSENNISEILYSESELAAGVSGSKDIEKKITLGKTTMPTYCPDMSEDDPKWGKNITPERKTICRNTYDEISERRDIEDDLYA